MAPKGMLLDTPERIAALAPAIRMQAVLTHAMPPNNLTEMTEAERAVLARWLDARRRRRELRAPDASDMTAAGERLMARLDAFAAFTDEPGKLTRLYLVAVATGAPRAFTRLGARERPVGADRPGRQRPRALRREEAATRRR